MHSTFSKIFPWFFGAVFTVIICGWFAIGYVVVKGVGAIDENGLKGVVEQVWCGKAADCKLPETAQ
tara:strand:- start:329 stop:526 length:198 start_codon:yes stop_codon:yes gene_type:complete